MFSALSNPTPHFGGPHSAAPAGEPVLMRKGKEKENEKMIQDMIELIRENRSIIEKYQKLQEDRA